MKSLTPLLSRYAQAFWYVLTVILPVIIRTGRRPVIFSKYSGIGDIICTFPAAFELKKRHPQATFIYNCHPDYICLPSCLADGQFSFYNVAGIGLVETLE